MNVIEIFNSIEGEGIRSGYLCTFVRLAECNLRCSYCDTKYSYDIAESVEYSVDDIIHICDSFGCKKITITGGEPLIHKDIYLLLSELCKAGYEVNIETNGSVLIPLEYMNKSIIYTVDYKCPSSGMESYMCRSNFSRLRKQDVLKFVVGNEEDMNKVIDIYKEFNLKCNVFISPVSGVMNPEDIVIFMKSHHLNYGRLQVQLHKIIWPSSMRGV